MNPLDELVTYAEQNYYTIHNTPKGRLNKVIGNQLKSIVKLAKRSKELDILPVTINHKSEVYTTNIVDVYLSWYGSRISTKKRSKVEREEETYNIYITLNNDVERIVGYLEKELNESKTDNIPETKKIIYQLNQTKRLLEIVTNTMLKYWKLEEITPDKLKHYQKQYKENQTLNDPRK